MEYVVTMAVLDAREILDGEDADEAIRDVVATARRAGVNETAIVESLYEEIRNLEYEHDTGTVTSQEEIVEFPNSQ